MKNKLLISLSIILLVLILVCGNFIYLIYNKKNINNINKNVTETEDSTYEYNEDYIKEKTEELAITYNDDKTVETSKNNKEITDNKIEEEKIIINNFLYIGNIENAINEINELIDNYYISDKDFENYLYEVNLFKDFDNKGEIEKIAILKSLKSPELILFGYLYISSNLRINNTLNENTIILPDYDLSVDKVSFYESYTAGLRKEIKINDIYFIVKNMEGYKIRFLINDKPYYLYYILHTDTDLIDYIGCETLTKDEELSTIKDYKNVWGN